MTRKELLEQQKEIARFQREQIYKLAADGLSKAEISGRLSVSSRTVASTLEQKRRNDQRTGGG